MLRSKLFLTMLVLITVYTLAGFFLTPFLVKHSLRAYFAKHLSGDLMLGQVRTNPYTLTVDLHNLNLMEKDGSPVLGLDRLFVNLEAKSLFLWAWTFGEIDISRPFVNVDIAPGGSVNLVQLAEDAASARNPSGSAEKAKKTQKNGSNAAVRRINIEKVRIQGGRITLSDRSGSQPVTESLESIQLSAANLTTTSDKSGTVAIDFTLPMKGRVNWKGLLSLTPIASTGRFTLEDVKPAVVWQFFQDKLRIQDPAGVLRFTASYRFRYEKSRVEMTVDRMAAALSGLELMLKDSDRPILKLSTVELKNGRFDLADRELTIGSCNVGSGSAYIAVDEAGRANWGQLVARKPVQAAADAGAPDFRPTGPFTVKLDGLDLSGLSVAYVDRSRIAPIEANVKRLNAHLSLIMEKKGSRTRASADGIAVEMDELTLHTLDADERLLEIATASINGGRLDLAGRRIRIDEMNIAGGQASVWRTPHGGINFVRLFGSRETGAIKKAAKSFPWAVEVSEFHLKNGAVKLSGRKLDAPDLFTLQDINLTVTHFKTAPDSSPFDYRLEFAVAQGGKGSMSGKGDIHKAELTAELKADRIALSPLQPYLALIARLKLDSGNLSLEGKLTYPGSKAGPPAFSGQSRIEDLVLVSLENAQRFLTLAGLSADGIALNGERPGLMVQNVLLNGLDGDIIIYPDRSLNIMAVIAGHSAPRSDTVKTSSGGAPHRSFPVQVKRVRIQESDLYFSDRSIKPSFSADIRQLEGDITGLSLQPGSFATVEMNGRVDPYGSVHIEGEIRPLDVTQIGDVMMRFRNINTTALTPYSIRFAGRKIASGKLNANFTYTVDHKQLRGENQITLIQFTLGERVPSPTALDIPFDLAIALLKDSSGNIHINLPVTGNIDHPDFSLEGIVQKALSNLLIKIVTSPFEVIGALVGTKGEKLNEIVFKPGSAALLPSDEERLDKLGAGLKKRPELMLEIKGVFNPALDGRALGEIALRRRIEKRIAQEPGATPGSQNSPIRFTDPSIQHSLDALAREMLQASELENLRKEHGMPKPAEKGTATPEKRKQEEGPDTAGYYRAVYQHLIDKIPVPDSDLDALGHARADAVIRYLTTTGDLSRSRISEESPTSTNRLQNGMVPLKLKLTSRK